MWTISEESLRLSVFRFGVSGDALSAEWQFPHPVEEYLMYFLREGPASLALRCVTIVLHVPLSKTAVKRVAHACHHDEHVPVISMFSPLMLLTWSLRVPPFLLFAVPAMP